jgi:hypothetical protein
MTNDEALSERIASKEMLPGEREEEVGEDTLPQKGVLPGRDARRHEPKNEKRSHGETEKELWKRRSI